MQLNIRVLCLLPKYLPIYTEQKPCTTCTVNSSNKLPSDCGSLTVLPRPRKLVTAMRVEQNQICLVPRKNTHLAIDVHISSVFTITDNHCDISELLFSKLNDLDFRRLQKIVRILMTQIRGRKLRREIVRSNMIYSSRRTKLGH